METVQKRQQSAGVHANAQFHDTGSYWTDGEPLSPGLWSLQGGCAPLEFATQVWGCGVNETRG